MIVKTFILLYSTMMAGGVRAMSPSQVAQFDGGEASNSRALSPPPISPIAASSEEQKEHENNKNEVHMFLQNI